MKKKSHRIKLNFDARMISNSGIGTQIKNVLTLILKEKKFELTLIGNSQTIHNTVSDAKFDSIEFNKPIYSISEQFKYPSLANDSILHCPHYNAPLYYIKRSVVVIHDLIHLQSKEFSGFQYRLYAWLMLSVISRFARRIITVSDTTRLELTKRFPKAAGKTSVIYNGINHDIFFPAKATQISKFRKSYNLPARFLLTVGIGKKHKNIDFLIRALAPLWKNGTIKEPLVIAGTKGKLPEYVKDVVLDLDVNKNVIVLPFIPEYELGIMYSSAKFFLYPSKLEGFGFPLVEAMACGCPVLASSASCLPEIGADAAMYFHPEKEDEFRSLYLEIRNNKEKLKKMTEAGLTRSKDFSWTTHTRQLIQLYKSINK